MATRFYLPSTDDATGISPTPDTNWEDTTGFGRTSMTTTKASDSGATKSFSDSNATDKDCLIRQFVSSQELTAGQTFTGGQTFKLQILCAEVSANNNLFLTVGLRIIASNGTTVRKTAIAVTRDATELASPASSQTNRSLTGTTAATNYTTVTGDYLVLEVGVGGDPSGGNDHDGNILCKSFSGQGDLPEDDASTATNLNPWFELADTLTFGEVAAIPHKIYQTNFSIKRGAYY